MAEPPIPATPRLSATVLLVRDDPFAVLMVRRAERPIDAFSAALVFPGGVVDPEDRADDWAGLVASGEGLGDEERALRVAACRETFEEAGILIADRAIPARPAATLPFAALVAAAGARLAIGDLVPFGHWITPVAAPRRFDTHFYLCRAPTGAEATCNGGETVALEWLPLHASRDRVAAGDDEIPFPTRMNLKRLAESPDVAAALAAARARPRFTVEPVFGHRDGATIVTISEAAGYGVTEDRRPF